MVSSWADATQGAVRAIALLHAGFLRMLSGCSHREIAMRTHRHRGAVSHDILDHRERFDADKSYANLTSRPSGIRGGAPCENERESPGSDLGRRIYLAMQHHVKKNTPDSVEWKYQHASTLE